MNLKTKIILVSYQVNACHIGSALSCADIVEDIHKKIKPRDIFIFGKASGVSAYYCFLYPEKKAAALLKKYPLPSQEAGCVWSGGSLGMSLSVACGFALADRTRDVYIILGDADIQEGQTWEALLFARQYKLKNLKIYVDRNYLQALGKTEEIIGIEKALKVLKKLFPIKVIKTIKGDGVNFLEGKTESHYYNLDANGFKKAIFQTTSRDSKKR
jgi:transketolase